MYRKRGGAVEACWAHNPEDGGSKPLSANFFFVLNETNRALISNILDEERPDFILLNEFNSNCN